MRNLRFVFTLILASILYAAPARAQQLVVQNEAGKTSVLTRADIEALPHVKVSARLSNAPATFDAVALSCQDETNYVTMVAWQDLVVQI